MVGMCEGQVEGTDVAASDVIPEVETYSNATFEELLDRTGLLAYTNKGSSMMPLLREDRDVMLIRKKGPEPCKRLDAVLFRRPGVAGRGAYVLHRVLRVNDDGTYWIVGDNCFAGETVADENVLGVLDAVVRNGRTIGVDDRLYRAYVHLWCDCYPVRFALLRVRGLLAGVKRRLMRARHVPMKSGRLP